MDTVTIVEKGKLVNMYMSFADIAKEQNKSLSYKIGKAREAIIDAYSKSKYNAALAFSGGKDSTVLWHLVRDTLPDDATIHIIFGNTGVEYPESLKFARQLGKEWGGEYFHETELDRTKSEGLKYAAQKEVLEWLIETGRVNEVLKADGKLKTTATLEKMATPEMWDDFRERKLVWKKGTLMSYWWCCDQYGFPILGKAASKLDARRINIDCFLRFSESSSLKQELLEYYDILKDCKFSMHCCKVLKIDPSEKMQIALNIDLIYKGLMASESRTRRTNFSVRGYIFQSSRPHLGDDPFYHCNPISIWTDDDIWKYIHRCNVPYSPLYDIEYIDNDLRKYRTVQRNGCYGCCTDLLFRNNHMTILRQTHPKLWQAVMKYGMADELKKLAHHGLNGHAQEAAHFDKKYIMEVRQCVFDEMEDYIPSTFMYEYDSELLEIDEYED